jgi:hypothetical protein
LEITTSAIAFQQEFQTMVTAAVANETDVILLFIEQDNPMQLLKDTPCVAAHTAERTL